MAAQTLLGLFGVQEPTVDQRVGAILVANFLLSNTVYKKG